MKTIITAAGNNLQAAFDLRFGRAAWFCTHDHDTGTTEFIRNPSAESTGGAGPAAAQMVIELGASKVISGDFGPKAQQILNKMKIQMVVPEESDTTVEDILNKIT